MKLTGNIEDLAYQTLKSGGFDLRSTVDVIINPGESYSVPTGIYVEDAEPNECILVTPRYGLARDYNITVLNSPGLVDADYPSDCEIFALLINLGKYPFPVTKGMRVAQGMYFDNITRLSQIPVKDVTRTGGGSSTGVD